MNSSLGISVSEVDLSSTTGTTTTKIPEEDFPWMVGVDYLCLFGFVVTSLGRVLNFFCYITARQMSQTNCAYLMRSVSFPDLFN